MWFSLQGDSPDYILTASSFMGTRLSLAHFWILNFEKPRKIIQPFHEKSANYTLVSHY